MNGEISFVPDGTSKFTLLPPTDKSVGYYRMSASRTRLNETQTFMSHSYVSQLMHCVFSTKERRPLITPELQSRLIPYMGGIARENKMKLIQGGGVDDHEHLLLSLPK